MPASLIPTSPNSQLYKDAENRFWSDWKGPYTKPSVVNVFYINHQRQQVWNNYDAYSKKVGNEKYMYHGATRACNLGDDNYQVIACQLVNCDVCSILRASIDPLILDPLSKFGLGAYVAPNSSKSANPTRYLKNANPTQSPNLVLLRCAVALGNTYYTKKAMLVTKPPDGYDSAITKLNGGIVKYSESVVFKRDAVLPVEVIVLRFPGSPGIPANPYSNFTKRLKNISGGEFQTGINVPNPYVTLTKVKLCGQMETHHSLFVSV
ncbi:hypothetical protein BDQ12DRAFT_722241 [Crucibulum laeve]|uniref:PARP catalytic domain-containing protein n=1 Tax=Crucibulum laeve TaxID=68775 RepID=A0A5C3M1V1_9AGAR|nr:hypothetical protein BDQ12DRAFT_722241 [Crucibulum laeve]